jgi:hypothetical protein
MMKQLFTQLAGERMRKGGGGKEMRGKTVSLGDLR